MRPSASERLIETKMTTAIINDQNLEKQMQKHMGGCIAGFFNIFDRNHLLSAKRLYTKRLPASTFLDSTSDSASSLRSPVPLGEFERPERVKSAPSPEHLRLSVTPPLETVANPLPIVSSPARSSVAAVSSPSFDFKEGLKSPWKFSREAPRLSLDSQAVVDAKGKLRPRELRTTAGNASDDDTDNLKRSPSVIARLMGLDQPLPSCELTEKKSELRRSASESRTRDAYPSVNRNAFPASQQYQSNSTCANTDNREKNNGGREFKNIDNSNANSRLNTRTLYQVGYIARTANTESAKPWQQQRNGLYDAGDFFPEPKRALAICSEIEKRLKMRGIQESSQDLETLKQIFEALQLKDLLHSNRPPELLGRRNFVYEQRFPHEESPIVVMKTARSPRRVANIELSRPLPGFRSKAVSHRIPSVSPRRDGLGMNRYPNPSSPVRSENRSTSPVTTRKRLNVETQRRKNETTEKESRRVSLVQSPRNGSRRIDQVAGQSPRSPAAVHGAEDESSAISDCSIRTRTCSHTDTERLKMEELKEGESLLERCDKLHPSPVSVLDSSMYKEQEESSPSPVMKRALVFKDRIADFEDEMWSPSSTGGAFQLKSPDTDNNTEDQQDPDFVYVSEILRVSNYLPEDTDVFLLLEKQQSITCRDTSRPKRKLIFDSVIEILERHRQLPPWESASTAPELRQIWSELQRIHVRIESEDLFEVICGVMKRDMAGDGWVGCPVEMSEAVLDIERLIFKDLIGETIHSLAAVARRNAVISAFRRKLVF